MLGHLEVKSYSTHKAGRRGEWHFSRLTSHLKTKDWLGYLQRVMLGSIEAITHIKIVSSSFVVSLRLAALEFTPLLCIFVHFLITRSAAAPHCAGPWPQSQQGRPGGTPSSDRQWAPRRNAPENMSQYTVKKINYKMFTGFFETVVILTTSNYLLKYIHGGVYFLGVYAYVYDSAFRVHYFPHRCCSGKCPAEIRTWYLKVPYGRQAVLHHDSHSTEKARYRAGSFRPGAVRSRVADPHSFHPDPAF